MQKVIRTQSQQANKQPKPQTNEPSNSQPPQHNPHNNQTPYIPPPPPNTTPAFPSPSPFPFPSTHNYKNTCTIKQLKNTNKCLTYQCLFNATLQSVEIQLLDMSHLELFVPGELQRVLCGGFCLGVGGAGECVGFWGLGGEYGVGNWMATGEYVQELYRERYQNLRDSQEYRREQNNKPQQVISGQDIKQKYQNTNQQIVESNFFRFIFQQALRKLQYQQQFQTFKPAEKQKQFIYNKQKLRQKQKYKEKREKEFLNDNKKYLYGVDGVLYSNMIIFTKLYEHNLQVISCIKSQPVPQLRPFSLMQPRSNFRTPAPTSPTPTLLNYNSSTPQTPQTFYTFHTFEQQKQKQQQQKLKYIQIGIRNKLQSLHARFVSYRNLGRCSLVCVMEQGGQGGQSGQGGQGNAKSKSGSRSGLVQSIYDSLSLGSKNQSKGGQVSMGMRTDNKLNKLYQQQKPKLERKGNLHNHKYKIILKIDLNVQPLMPNLFDFDYSQQNDQNQYSPNYRDNKQNNLRQVDSILKYEQQQLMKILKVIRKDLLHGSTGRQSNLYSYKQEGQLKQQCMIPNRQYSGSKIEQKEQKSINMCLVQKYMKKIQKILEVPRIYILCQKCDSKEKFQSQVRMVKNSVISDSEMLWYLCKYEQVNAYNQSTLFGMLQCNFGTYGKSAVQSIINPLRTQQGLSGKTNLKSTLTQPPPQSPISPLFQYPKKPPATPTPTPTPLFHTSTLSTNYLHHNSQCNLLWKQYKNLLEDRYVVGQVVQVGQEGEAVLGWGELAIRYYYGWRNYGVGVYTGCVGRYVGVLGLYAGYTKVRRIYCFYSGKLLQLKNQLNQSICFYKQCLYLIKRQAQKILGYSKTDKNQAKIQNELQKTKSSKIKILLIQQLAIYQQIGRLCYQTKRQEQSLYWFNKALKIKSELYGRYSIQLLSTLYNILFVQINSSHGTQVRTFKLYLNMLAQIKQRIRHEQSLKKWLNTANIKPSVLLITKVEQQLTNLYVNPWTQTQERLFAAAMSDALVYGASKGSLSNMSFNAKFNSSCSLGEHKIQQIYNEYKPAIQKLRNSSDFNRNPEISYRNQARQIITLYIYEYSLRKQLEKAIANKNTQQIQKIVDHYIKLKERIEIIKQFYKNQDRDGVNTQSTIKQLSQHNIERNIRQVQLQILDIYIDQKIRPILLKKQRTFTIQSSLKLQINYIKRMKQLLIPLQKITNENIEDKKFQDKHTSINKNIHKHNFRISQLCLDIREMIYDWYKKIAKMLQKLNSTKLKNNNQEPIQYLQEDYIDWEWILKQYYQYKYHKKVHHNASYHSGQKIDIKTRDSDKNMNMNSGQVGNSRIAGDINAYLMYNTGLYNVVKQESVCSVIEYCLLIYKYYGDSGHIYNILNCLSNPVKAIQNPTTCTQQQNQLLLKGLSKYSYSQQLIIVQILSITLIQMNKYKQALSVIKYQQGMTSSESVSGEDQTLQELYGLLPKKGIYKEEFLHMKLFCLSKLGKYNQFVELFQNIYYVQQINDQNQPKNSVESQKKQQNEPILTKVEQILQDEEQAIKKIAIKIYYKLYRQNIQQIKHLRTVSNYTNSFEIFKLKEQKRIQIAKKIQQIFLILKDETDLGNVIFLKAIQGKIYEWNFNQHKPYFDINIVRKLIKYISRILFPNQKLLKKQTVLNQYHHSILELLQQSQQKTQQNLKEFYNQSINILLKYLQMLCQTIKKFKVLCEKQDCQDRNKKTENVRQYETFSKEYQNISSLLAMLISIITEQNTNNFPKLANLTDQTSLAKHSTNIIACTRINLQLFQTCNHIRTQFIQTQPIIQKSQCYRYVNVWLARLIGSIGQGYVYNKGKGNFNRKGELKQIFQILLDWFRYQCMYKESTLCLLWLYNNDVKLIYNQNQTKQLEKMQYQALTTQILQLPQPPQQLSQKPRKKQQKKFTIPQPLTILNLSPFFQHIVHSIHQINQQCQTLCTEYWQLVQDGFSGKVELQRPRDSGDPSDRQYQKMCQYPTSYAIEEDQQANMDRYIERIQQTLSKIDAVKYNMQNLLPSFYMDRICENFFNVLQERLEEL